MRTFYVLLGLLFILPFSIIAQELPEVDEIAPFSEGLAAVRKGNQWGFINKQGNLVIDFRDDIYANKQADMSKSDVTGIKYPMFNEGRCLITKKVEDGIPLYGFMDTKGEVVIEPQFLNVYPFKNGYTTGVLFDRTFKGENEFKLKIYEFKFFDVLVHSSGKVEEYFQRRQNIHMAKRRYEIPSIGAKRLSADLIAVHIKDKGWQIRNLNLEN
ncbi:MAG: WG repeat-containing protein [Flavobacteriaceae bacterium]